jgi:lipopolysaccharide biosynthesis regulator YciM
VTDTALLAILIAAIAGLLAGRAWAAARHGERDPEPFRASPHYTQGLHYLAAGQVELAISELTKVARENPGAVQVQQVLGNLLREAGQVERAIQVHQSLLGRGDLARAERAYSLACLGTDFRKAGFIDRATRTYNEVLQVDPKNIHALVGLQKLHEEQRQWKEAYEIQTRLSRLRKTEDTLVLGFLQAEMGHEAVRMGQAEAAEQAFKTALLLHREVFPAYLGIADLYLEGNPRRAVAILEEALSAVPGRAYLTFDRLSRAYAACGEPSRFVTLCETIIRQDPRDWRARLALARHLGTDGRQGEAFGLLLRAVAANPHVLLLHIEALRVLATMNGAQETLGTYAATVEESAFYRDPHICTACRYRAEHMLWRCPHCHEWNTLVEERLLPTGGTR